MTETPDVAPVVEALRRGVRVLWDPPRYRGPAEALALAKGTPETAREVLRRAAIFRAQAQRASVCPLLVLPEATLQLGGCISCGVSIPCGFRCGVCQIAVQLALDLDAEDPPR